LTGGGAEPEPDSTTANIPDLKKRQHSHSYERVAADGERFFPHLFRDGCYRAANPALGKTKHHAGNQIAIQDHEIGLYLEKGFLLRMRGENSGQVNLIAASEIQKRRDD